MQIWQRQGKIQAASLYLMRPRHTALQNRLPDADRRAAVESAHPVARFTESGAWPMLAAGCHATSVHRSSCALADSFLEQPAAFQMEIRPPHPTHT